MKLRNRIVSLSLILIVALLMVIPTFATENEIIPYFNNTSSVQDTFQVTENGKATISFTCRGYRGMTTKIVVNSVIQKQSGSSWVDVAGASWTDESTLYYCVNDHSVQLTSSGTYKATITYTVYGSGGEADVIVSEYEKTY